MGTLGYFKHARKLGAFTASDCLTLARAAAELDNAAKDMAHMAPVVVWNETLPDETGLLRASNGITVY